MKKRTDVIFSVDSILADESNGSGDFIYQLPTRLDGCVYIRLLGGSIPPTTEPYLYVDIDNLRIKQVMGPSNKKYFSIIRYELPAVAEQNLIDLEKKLCSSTGLLGTITQVHIKIYDRLGNLYSFGTDKLSIGAITNASPANITTTANHGLINGDVIYIKDVPNFSTQSVKNFMESTSWIVTVVDPTNFTIVADLTGEAVNQQETGSTPPYRLGLNTHISHPGDNDYGVVSIVLAGTVTRLETGRAHSMTAGKLIKITGFDNGATISDNNLINGQHIVTNVSDNTHIDIGVQLSSYVTPRQPTSTETAWTLGLRGYIFVAKYQCSFDFLIESIGSVVGLI